MKSSDEMLDSLFERREKYMAQKKAKMQKIGRAASVTACFCMAALVGIGVWYSNIGSQPNVVEPNDPDPNKNITVTDKTDTMVNTEENNVNTDENTANSDESTSNDEPQVPEDTTGEVPEGIGGGTRGLKRLNEFFPNSITGIRIGAPELIEGSFVHERFDELTSIIDKYDALPKTLEVDLFDLEWSYYSNLMWHITQEMNLTREDLEIYNKSVFESYKVYFETSVLEDIILTDEQIDALLIKDEEEARKALRSPYTLYSEVDNNIYRMYDLAKLTDEEFDALGFTSEEVRDVVELIDSDKTLRIDYAGYHEMLDRICEMAGIDRVSE